MNPIFIVKTISGLAVTAGVGTIAKEAIKMVAPVTQSTKLIEKVCIGIGGLVLGGMVSDKAVDYVNEKIDDITESIKAMNVKAEETEAV